MIVRERVINIVGQKDIIRSERPGNLLRRAWARKALKGAETRESIKVIHKVKSIWSTLKTWRSL